MKPSTPTSPLSSPPEKNSLEDLVAVRVVRMAEIICRISSYTMEANFGLRSTDLRILNALENRKLLTVSEIARRTHVDKAWISRSLNQLEEKRLIKRAIDKADSRCILITLTKRGSNLLEKVRPVAQASEGQMLTGLNRAKFKTELDQLMENLEQRLADVTKNIDK